MSRREAASYLGVKPQTLAAWACRGTHPIRHFKVGSKTVYDRAELDRFLAARERTHTGEDISISDN